MSQGKDEFIGIGDNLKRLRGRMGLSLSEVANMTGVSKTMLSQIERSESTPTISTIWKISNGLKVKFDTLLDTTPTHLCDIRRIADVIPLCDKSGLAENYCMVPFSPVTGYEFFYCTYKPSCSYHSYGHKNSRSELIFVFEGAIDLEIESKTYHVEAGSTITFDAAKPHSYVNNGDRDANFCSLVSYE